MTLVCLAVILPIGLGPQIVLAVVGLFMVYNGYTGREHIRIFGIATLGAAKKADVAHVPYFEWSRSRKEESAPK